MNIPGLNINVPHDWKDDLSICIKAIRRLVIFCAAVLVITLAFLHIYNVASRGSQPYDVYTAEDLQVAIYDPFVNKIILHEDITDVGLFREGASVITFKEEAAWVAEDFGLEDQNLWYFGVDDVHGAPEVKSSSRQTDLSA